MFLNFFNELRAAKIPVTLKEYLILLEAMDKQVIDMEVEDFYYLSRTALVKDERNLDKFDKIFGSTFKGLDGMADALDAQEIPEEWLRKMTEKFLTPEEMAEIEALGGFEKLMETAINGSEPAAPPPSAQTVTTPKACASGRTNPATAAQPKFGTSASLKTSMIA